MLKKAVIKGEINVRLPSSPPKRFISFFNSEVFKNGYLKAFFWEPPRLHAKRPLDFLVIAVLIE